MFHTLKEQLQALANDVSIGDTWGYAMYPKANKATAIVYRTGKVVRVTPKYFWIEFPGQEKPLRVAKEDVSNTVYWVNGNDWHIYPEILLNELAERRANYQAMMKLTSGYMTWFEILTTERQRKILDIAHGK